MNAAVSKIEVRQNRTQKRVSKTHKRLMQAAMAVITEGGESSTIEMITERADLGKGTFYRHFRDKDDLLRALTEKAVDDLIATISESSGPPQTLEAALELLVQGHMNFFLGHREAYTLLFQGRVLLKMEQELVEEIEQPYGRYVEYICRWVGPFIQCGPNQVKVRRLACAVAGFVSGFLSFALIALEPAAIREAMQPMRGAFVRSMVIFLERS